MSLTSVSLTTRKGRRKASPPPNLSRRFRTHSPQAVKLRLTLFLQPNHGFGESFRGSGHRRPHKFFNQTLRWNRPEDSPKPSIRASVPSTSSSRPLTSRSHARLASLLSSPKASSASFNSLSNECHWRCKETSWCQVERTSSRAAPACAPHTAEVVIASPTL